MKQTKNRVNVHEMDDDALEILYAWANNAILTHKPQCEKLITQILTEYEQRKTAQQFKQYWHTNDNPAADYDIVFFDDTGVRHLGYYDKDLGFIEYGSGDVFTAGEIERWAWVDDLVDALTQR